MPKFLNVNGCMEGCLLKCISLGNSLIKVITLRRDLIHAY
nr:MAG TPA: hypothetical protein [Bacteriophage sp.]